MRAIFVVSDDRRTLYRTTGVVNGELVDAGRWLGDRWSTDVVWMEDWLEGRFDPIAWSPSQIEEMIPGAI